MSRRACVILGVGCVLLWATAEGLAGRGGGGGGRAGGGGARPAGGGGGARPAGGGGVHARPVAGRAPPAAGHPHDPQVVRMLTAHRPSALRAAAVGRPSRPAGRVSAAGRMSAAISRMSAAVGRPSCPAGRVSAAGRMSAAISRMSAAVGRPSCPAGRVSAAGRTSAGAADPVARWRRAPRHRRRESGHHPAFEPSGHRWPARRRRRSRRRRPAGRGWPRRGRRGRRTRQTRRGRRGRRPERGRRGRRTRRRRQTWRDWLDSPGPGGGGRDRRGPGESHRRPPRGAAGAG